MDEAGAAGVSGQPPPDTNTAPQAPPAIVDVDALVSDTKKKFSQWAQARRPFEGSWFLNAAFLRGQQRVEYNDALAKLVTPVVPASRIQLSINRIRPKIKARLAKFFKNRPRPVVIASNSDHQSVLNARATESFLTYEWYRQHLEEKYKDVRLWATVGAKGFLGLRWDASANAKVRTIGPNGENVDEIAPVGDLDIEVESPFSIYPADNTISRLGQQPEYIHAKMRDKGDVQARYPQLEKLQDSAGESTTTTQRTIDRLGSLNKRQDDKGGAIAPVQTHDKQVMVLQHFIAPCAKYPQGHYRVVVGSELAKFADALPYGFADHPGNPFPHVEFQDQESPGQFWGTTLVEQMIDLQREYNFVRSMVSENLRMMARPKIVVYKQHQLAEGAWTTAAGEIVELSFIPGLPPPQIVQPANIANDAWQLLALINREFDDLSLIQPSTQGKAGDATSGYQTNLLQEAADSVHAPDIRNDELAIQELAWKMRRLAKLAFTAPRLMAILGENSSPQVMAFGQDQIDEYAEVRIQAGSMLPDLKSARIQTIQAMAKDGLFGNLQDAFTRKRVLNLVDMGGLEVVQDAERADAEEAQNENSQSTQGQPVLAATYYQDHIGHLFEHLLEMKTPSFKVMAPPVQQAKVAHSITHYDFLNPALAWGLRQQFNLQQLPVATPPQPPPPPAPAGAPAPAAGPAPHGAAPPAPSPAGPPPSPAPPPQ